ncbi:MAG TPA: FAD-dependent oxidoreductase [Blastocatellia bacterium]|nr:FAD-dependent oxidoreductase [Blastocatellia bacterium]
MSSRIDRREFIKEIGFTAAALAFFPHIARAQSRGGLRLQGEPKNIVVLGGGLAGLAAAYELKLAGHKVTILEARKNPGGRVRTLRNFSDGLYAEAGPISFPQDHEFTWGYASDFKLPLRPAFKFGLESVAHVRGSRFRIASNGAANVPFSLKASERQAGVFNLPALYLSDYMGDVGNPRRANWPPDHLREIDQVSLKQLLGDLGASDGAIDLIEASQLGLLGFGLDSFSALDGVVTEKIATGGAFYEIMGGNDLLPNAFKKKLKKNFKKQCVVRRIEQDDARVTVTYLNNGEQQTITADRVICTLPFPILNEIDISPALSEEKQRAIRELKLTPITRTYLQFRSKAWEADGLSGYGNTDLAIQNTYSPTLTQGGERGILASYTGGARALELGAMTESERQALVLRRMNSLFGDLSGKFERSTSQIWHLDEFARGAFAYFEPGQMTSLLPVAQRPEGRIHFAGEHTSAWHGWMNGALESGNRAADEANQAESAEALTISSNARA